MAWVRVPASSANIGCGFDCLGVALSLYNTITVDETDSGMLEFENKNAGEFVPAGENNMIYRAAKVVFDKVGYSPAGIKITQKSSIPMTRGLGSSSACIIGGMLGANVISGRKLSYSEIMELAAQMEGHPDNVAPALYGGFCASVMYDGGTLVRSVKLENDLCFAAIIPNFYLSTKSSRSALPETVAHKDAAFNVARAAVLAMSVASGRLENLRELVRDRLHQPYRGAYIDNMEQIFDRAYLLGAEAVWLSGSGPTIIAAVKKSAAKGFTENMDAFLQDGNKSICMRLDIDNVGAVVCENKE